MKWTQAELDRFLNHKQASTPKRIVIGIDPDTIKSGVCVLQKATKSITLYALRFFELQDFLSANKSQIDVVKIEAGWLNKKNNFRGAKNVKIAATIGAHVGANLEAGKKIVEMCEYVQVPYRLVKPLRKVWKSKDGKISHEELNRQINFRGLNGFPVRTNQEMRDAALICFNG